MPDGSEHGTHRLVSDVPRPVHWLTRMCSGRQDVKLHGAQRVASLEVVPSQKPIWYWPGFFHVCVSVFKHVHTPSRVKGGKKPGWQDPHGTQRVVS